MIDGKTLRDHTAALEKGTEALLLPEGRPRPATRCSSACPRRCPRTRVRLRFRPTSRASASTRPSRRSPGRPGPATTGRPASSTRDTTGGLNRDGDVVIHVPHGHVASVIDKQRAGWLRGAGHRARGGPARLQRLAEHHGPDRDHDRRHGRRGERRDRDRRGARASSEGVPGQRFVLKRGPSCPATSRPCSRSPTTRAGTSGRRSPDFADSEPDDRHFMLDASAGEIRLGPAVRLADGTLRQYGAVPPKGARVRLRRVPHRRRRRGQRRPSARSACSSRRSRTWPASRTGGPRAGGVDGEDIENAKVRGPIRLRDPRPRRHHRGLRAARPRGGARGGPGAGRGRRRRRRRGLGPGPGRPVRGVRARPAALRPAGAPRTTARRRSPTGSTSAASSGRASIVEPPVYRGITVVARLRARPRVNPTRLQEDALLALYEYFHPITGGPDGTGWPFGRPVQVGEVYAVLQGLRGTELVEDVRLFGADPVTGQRGQATQRLDLEPHALVFSYEHQLLVEGA